MCNRLDSVPYKSDFNLVQYLDHDNIAGDLYQLSPQQFREIVLNFQYQTENNVCADGSLQIKQRALRPDNEITICTEFTIDGVKQSIRRFLDGDEYELLSDFEANQEKIKDCITKRIQRGGSNVDDMPYIIGLEIDIALDLHKEYQSIIKKYQEEKVPVPIKAFFGDFNYFLLYFTLSILLNG